MDTGHGTHTTLSALGRGTGSGEEQGTAPAAQLIFQAVEDFVDYGDYCDLFFDNLYDGYYLTGIPNNIANLFEEAYNQGARIHSNSWGWNAKGYYDVNSKNADQFIWDHQYMTITYSAGNSGIDVNKDGVIDSDSIGSPGTAKNVITVGASENERSDNYPCDDSVFPGCNNEPLFTYGQAWPKDFPANPIKDDPSGGNPEQMVAFSSRGETDDGRIKPDLVAPGTWVLSGYSDMYQQGYDPSRNPQNKAWQYDGWGLPHNSFYKYMGGTSMASPLTAGGAAVVRDFYEKTDGHDASAALVKATLINSAHDLLDENNDGVDDNDLPIPNVHEGWGRVDLANATDGSHQYVDDTSGLFTEGGQQPGSSTHYYSVVSTGPFKVTLVWSDYPSATGVSKNLVNDLDLKVTSPQGTIYRGNFFSGGWSVTGGTEDRTNNVENVYVEFPEPGTWTVEVKGYNVVYGPQPFALVVDGADFNKTPIASFSANPTSGPYPLTVFFDASDSSDPDGAIVRHDWDFGDGGTATVADPVHEYQTAGEYNATLTVTDDDGATGSASKTITVTAPANITQIGNLTATSKAFRSLWRMKVTVRVHDTDHDPVANATVLYTWSDTPNTIRNDCFTKSDGTCTVSGWQFRGTCLTFEVKDILHSSLDYEAAANDVPDDITDCR